MDLGLAGRAVLVTGASSGVGLATARMLLAEGAHVACCARDFDRLKAAVDPLPRAAGARVHLAACDVRDREQVDEFITATEVELGGLDAVVANAGRSLMAPLDETTDEQVREEFDLKIFALLNVVRAARPLLAASPVASVVAVNAILARQPEVRLPITSAARAALLNLTRSLTTELGADGIRINSVLLGLVDTGQWRRRYDAADTALDFEQWSAELAADRGVPLGRLGTAAEVAFPILSLLSPLSGFTTGASLDVGGGVARYA